MKYTPTPWTWFSAFFENVLIRRVTRLLWNAAPTVTGNSSALELPLPRRNQLVGFIADFERDRAPLLDRELQHHLPRDLPEIALEEEAGNEPVVGDPDQGEGLPIRERRRFPVSHQLAVLVAHRERHRLHAGVRRRADPIPAEFSDVGRGLLRREREEVGRCDLDIQRYIRRSPLHGEGRSV